MKNPISFHKIHSKRIVSIDPQCGHDVLATSTPTGISTSNNFPQLEHEFLTVRFCEGGSTFISGSGSGSGSDYSSGSGSKSGASTTSETGAEAPSSGSSEGFQTFSEFSEESKSC